MKLSEIKAEKDTKYYCEDCKQELDARQVAYHVKFGHIVTRTETPA